MGLGAQGDAVAAELVVYGEVEETESPDEAEDDKAMGGDEFSGEHASLDVFCSGEHSLAEFLADGVHAGDERLEVLDVAEQLRVVFVDPQAETALLSQDLWNFELV